jgi:phosphoribosylaminoimidazole-succinocarboxamide synthase
VERPDAREMLYEGKAKQVFATDDPDRVIVRYKDDATAFNAQKRGTVAGKGEVNNAVTALLYPELEDYGVPTHFLERLSEREQLVRRVRIVPVEVIVRNRAAGTFASRYGVEEGRPLDPTVIEFCLKSDALGDPPMNAATAVALGHASEEELETLFDLAAEVNDYLLARFAAAGLDLIDFKLEFGVDRRRRAGAGGRDQPRHLPPVGRRDRREARQGPLPPRPRRGRGGVPRGAPAARGDRRRRRSTSPSSTTTMTRHDHHDHLHAHPEGEEPHDA